MLNVCGLLGLTSLFALLYSVAAEVAAIPCTTPDCTTNCHLFDETWDTCNNDYPSLGYNSLTECACTYKNMNVTVGELALCSVCEQDGLGRNPLALYQVWTVICGTYLAEGESAAVSVGSSRSSFLEQEYSTIFQPVLESSVCEPAATGGGGGGGGGVSTSRYFNTTTSAAPTDTPTTSSAAQPAGSTTSTPSVTSGLNAGSTSSTSTASTTPSGAAASGRAVVQMLGLPLAMAVLL